MVTEKNINVIKEIIESQMVNRATKDKINPVIAILLGLFIWCCLIKLSIICF